jgi:hypothetical protein
MPRITSPAISALLLALSAAAAPAQTITTAAAGGAIAQVPANGPMALGLLLAALLLAAWRQLRRGPAAHRVLAWLAVAVLGLAMHDAGLLALPSNTFTNPAGQTLPIPVVATTSGTDFTGFEEEHYQNSAGAALRVSALAPPTLGQCFTAGHTADTLLQPGTPSASATPVCAIGTVLADGAACRVDVDAICRGLLGPSPSLAGASPNSGPPAGGTAVTLSGTHLTGATSVNFDGVPGTSVTVVNDTTITVTTPAHAAGAVDVTASTPAGIVTLAGGFAYSYTVGQPLQGGVVATLAPGGMPDLIAASADSSTGAAWGGYGTAIGASAQSNTDGSANTTAIVAALGPGSYAAALCTSLVDGGYTDWYLPAEDQLTALQANQVAIGGFGLSDFYWSSTEFTSNPAFYAQAQYFAVGAGYSVVSDKNTNLRVRCVRNYTP